MSEKSKFFRTALAVFYIVSILFISCRGPVKVCAADKIGFVVLDTYSKTMKIGDEYYLLAVTSNGKKPVYSSSDSRIASVNTYGKITAKKAGTVKITAKIKNGEASCKVRVEKTTIELGFKFYSLEVGESIKLSAQASTCHKVTFRSGKKSVAEVTEDGTITAKKPGKAAITAAADKTSVTCTITVKKPNVSLNRKSIKLYRKGQCQLVLKTSSKSVPVWKSNKKSVAIVDENGLVTAIKNGTAIITVTVDGVSRTCEVTVKQPTVRFDEKVIYMKAGEERIVRAKVSSQNIPEYSSSNTCVAIIDANGRISAVSAGKAFIYAKEDGIKARIQVIVEE